MSFGIGKIPFPQPWLSPNVANAAGNLGTGGALILFALATWYLVPLAESGWKPTDPIQNKPTQVWRPGPHGTAVRVLPAWGNNTAGNQSGGSSITTARAPQLSGSQKVDLWAQTLGSIVQQIAPSAPTGGGYAGSGVTPAWRPAPPRAWAGGRQPESFAPRGYTIRPRVMPRAPGPASGRLWALRPTPYGMYGGYRPGFGGGGWAGGFGGGGLSRGFGGGFPGSFGHRR